MNSTLLDLRESVVLEEHKRAEQAEADYAELCKVSGKWRDLFTEAEATKNDYMKMVDEYAVEVTGLKATIEQLKVCGNCDELGGDYGDECCRSWLGPVEPYYAYRPSDNVTPYEHCHFTPSRWAERGIE